MKKYLTILLLLVLGGYTQAETLSLAVKGDADKFYPVVFKDQNWFNHVPTEIEIGRSNVHEDESWKGSLMARFRFHDFRWGNGAHFTDVDITQQANNRKDGSLINVPFIAGYLDASQSNGSVDFIIWLRGNTTYNYRSNVAQSPIVYDGIQNALPFQEENGPAHSFKTTVDDYVNSGGKSVTGSIYLLSAGVNYMAGNLGIGTMTPREKLSVNGNIRAKEVKVEAANWPDYVFEEGYNVGTLEGLESYIKTNKHLPEMPSAREVEGNGIQLGEMNKLLLKKVEELTLYLIEQQKDSKLQKQYILLMEDRLFKLESKK